ncbi:MAG: hypothetical protein IT580_17080, partial [Verrucomicrobiales bacterium]|nr:hypothetical protein [Verrucomicrobiales bacterium]
MKADAQALPTLAIRCLALLGLGAGLATAQTPIDTFEYATDDEALALWTPSANALVSTTNSVSSASTGQHSLRLEFHFPSGAWATESVRGADLAELLVIAPEQYLTFRVHGDAAFAAADFRTLYLYAYDDAGNFGRWGAPTPNKAGWQVRNHLASGMEKPWDSPGLPDLSRIVRFAFFQYGSEAAIPEYTAVVLIDDLQVRDTPLEDLPATGSPILADFEYATVDLLTAAWTPSANAVVSLSEDVAPKASGRTSMRIDFQFPSSAWATETVSGPALPVPSAMSPTQYLTFRVKGDPAFTGSDFRQLFLYVYDDSGNFGRWGEPIPLTSAWQIRNHAAGTIEKPWDSPALPNLARIAKIAFFQYGSETAIPAYAASVLVDEVVIRDEPLVEGELPPDTVINAFEYASAEALTADWVGGSGNVVVSTSDTVAATSAGRTAMSIQFNFVSSAWTTEFVKGPVLTNPVAVARNQYLSFRLKGDPAFAVADFRNLYLYAYDNEGNFGRWGSAVPDTEDWQIVNYTAGTIEKPWDSPSLPNLERLVRF